MLMINEAMFALEESFLDTAGAFSRLGFASRRTALQFKRYGAFVQAHREEWLTTLPGQWPDKFTLLNRYVRSDLEPPYIFND